MVRNPYGRIFMVGLVQADGLERLINAKGYSRMDKTICTRAGRTGWLAGAGQCYGSHLYEIEDSDLTVFWGVNVVATQISTMRHLTRAKNRNPDHYLVVIDPYCNATAQKADMHLALRPGTDAALACAVMHVMFRDGMANHDYMAQYCDFPKELEAHLQSRNPEWASKITGLDPKQIEDFSVLYGKTERAFIRFGLGFTRQRNGSVQMHAASCLPAVGGKWLYKGGGGFFMQSECFKSLDRSFITGEDRYTLSARELDMSHLGAILNHDQNTLKGGPPVKAMFFQNTNPMQVCPEWPIL